MTERDLVGVCAVTVHLKRTRLASGLEVPALNPQKKVPVSLDPHKSSLSFLMQTLGLSVKNTSFWPFLPLPNAPEYLGETTLPKEP